MIMLSFWERTETRGKRSLLVETLGCLSTCIHFMAKNVRGELVE